MRSVDFAEMLQEVLEAKLNRCRREMLDAYRSREPTGSNNGVTIGSRATAEIRPHIYTSFNENRNRIY
jgi:hypothetical protein